MWYVIKIPWPHLKFPDFSRFTKFPDNFRFSRFVGTPYNSDVCDYQIYTLKSNVTSGQHTKHRHLTAAQQHNCMQQKWSRQRADYSINQTVINVSVYPASVSMPSTTRCTDTGLLGTKLIHGNLIAVFSLKIRPDSLNTLGKSLRNY